jgi:hypothetical protein
MNKQALLDTRMNRILKAVSLEEAPGRVPVVLEYASFAARVTKTPQSEFLLNLERSIEVMIQAWHLVAEKTEADAINYGRFSPYNLSFGWLSKVAVPGVDLPENVPYQVIEKELLTTGDYDAILEQGWPKFYRTFLQERVFNDVPHEYLPWNQPAVDARAEWGKIGVPVLNVGTVAPPFEYLCGGRGMTNFYLDLLEIPDKIEAVMKEIIRHERTKVYRKSKSEGYPAVWVGGWRTAPAMLSPEIWSRFVWPYLIHLIREVIDYKLIPLLHFDGNWDRELERFKELPAGKMIFAFDGYTDIIRAKEILGNHSCIMGDVPAVMLFNSTPEEVYEYSSKLVNELGPRGFILHSGCDIPENAKLKNVQAMVSAAVNG